MAKREGHCLCGKVSFELTAEPVAVAVCYCTHCQRQSGALFSTNLIVPEANYVQKGETKRFTDKGDSGKAVWRDFCAECGSPIISTIEAMPGIVAVKAGTLNDITGLKPGIEVYCDHAATFLPHIPGTQRFAQAMG
ncbi:MAG: aldehyde-activating protein [Alphaproteobacteria bacterium]|nr:aldehyde-activating protein [Alphaproteobacteria bacterium]